MNSKNITILFITLLLIILGTSLLLQFNNKPANYTPPPPDFESNQSKYNELINNAQQAYKDKNFQAAYTNYKEALKFYPGNQGILQNMGKIKFQTKEYKEAEKIYEGLCKSSPDQPSYRVSLAFSLVYQHKFKEAELVLEQAKRLRSNNANILLISAALAAHKNQIKECVSFLKEFPKPNLTAIFIKETIFDKIRSEKEFKSFADELLKTNKKEDKK